MKRLICCFLLVAVILSACVSLAESSGSSKLEQLNALVDEMWLVWNGSWKEANEKGILIPLQWSGLPFITWAGLAPDLEVAQDGSSTVIRISETLPEGWSIRTGKDIPIVYTDCLWNDAAGGWIPQAPFDLVCLSRDQTTDRIGISISYEAANQYLASSPVVEWISEEEGRIVGFNCYAWGTALSFDGGMYAYVNDPWYIYAEYDSQGKLKSWMDAMTECFYDAEDHLISGEEPEGYVIPVIH